jgi:hypothetical protein
MKLLPIALVLAGTTGLSGLAFAAGQTGAVRNLTMPGETVATEVLSLLELADFSAGEDDDEDGEDDDEGGDDDDDGYSAGAMDVCVTGLVSGDDDEDVGAIICDPAGQAMTGPAAVAPDPNRDPIFSSAPIAVIN